ncbi:MAG: cytochrome bc complex cytochrome b subunit [Fimbriimonadaceae bacterium]|nr:cytochrome bc complex cytochrome b subunit [Fimbriimonadaceae bacterium]
MSQKTYKPKDAPTLSPEVKVDEPREAVSSEERLQIERPSLRDWMDLRLGWYGFVRKNLDEPMPAGVGWWQTLGNLLMTLLVFQFITGFALAMYYSPSPDSAHASVKHLTYEVGLGSFIRGLHSWGSTVIVIAVVLHMLRVFFWGSYKKPRELTWVVGVIIFQVILGFSFTGYLLPWDQKAYWATVVGTRIAATIPVVGHALLVFIRGGEEVGALTLTRFYSFHVMLLPASLILFTFLHLYLVRRHHIAGPVTPAKGAPVPFYPNQLFKDAIVLLFGVGLLIYLAVALPPGLEAIADPTGTDFSPRPEWYFLGLYELLKVMPSGWEVVATVIIPTGITIGMFALPWLDRSKSRHPAKRQWIIMSGFAAILLIGLMTLKGILETPPEHKKSEATLAESNDIPKAEATQLESLGE